MVRREKYRVIYIGGRNPWEVQYGGRSGAWQTGNIYATKREAVNKARKAAKTDEMPSKLIVENQDGSYSEESNYGQGEPTTKRGGKKELTGGVYGGRR